MTNGYLKWVKAMLRRGALVMIMFGIFTAVTLGMFNTLPTGFVPIEDKGAFMMDMQLPEGASLSRTKVAAKEIEDILKTTPGVADIITVVGFSILEICCVNICREAAFGADYRCLIIIAYKNCLHERSSFLTVSSWIYHPS